MNIVKSQVSMDGDKVSIRDEDSENVRVWSALRQFRSCHNAAEDFAFEGVSFVHLYSFDGTVSQKVVEFLTARNELNLMTIREKATIPQLEEVVLQETKTAEDFQVLANKQPGRRQEFLDCAAHALASKEESELTIKAIKESAQYTEFGKG